MIIGSSTLTTLPTNLDCALGRPTSAGCDPTLTIRKPVGAESRFVVGLVWRVNDDYREEQGDAP